MVAEEVLSILKKDFDLPAETKVADEDSLFRLFVPIVSRMLDREFERLLQVCYRIDIGEEKLKKILHESPPENMAEELTRAMIDRQVQKIEIRKKYSK